MMNLLNALGLCIALTLSSLQTTLDADLQDHDFHASIAEMTYRPKRKAWEVIVKIFTDDLEDHINRGRKSNKIHIDFAAKDKTVDQAIEQYLNQHFFLVKKGQRTKIQYKYRKADVEATTIHFDIPMRSPNHIQLYNTILLDFFEDQNNIVNIRMDGQKKTKLYNSNDRKHMLDF